MRKYLGAFLAIFVMQAQAQIPATPVMTVYEFNGPQSVPYYRADDFARSGTRNRAGTLAQGTSVIPCLVLRNGQPLTDSSGTPYVGFQIVVDARNADPSSTQKFRNAVAAREHLQVPNHVCPAGVTNVVNVRDLYILTKPPFFPPAVGSSRSPAISSSSSLDRIVRAFHESAACGSVDRRLMGRREALERAWNDFIASHKQTVGLTTLARAKHLDYTMRTALFEGHLMRGCNAYGACERNIIALTIRNRAVGDGCISRYGCTFPGDFQGVSSKVSQYNIWDEYLTQISGLTACYLRPQLSSDPYFAKLQAMYKQSAGSVERILYGTDADLQRIFPGNSLYDLKSVRHYYHAPAMGKCFPNHPRVEYISGAVARKGSDFALIANMRVEVGDRVGNGYLFKEFRFTEDPDRDRISVQDSYPGFVIDGRKVSLRAPTNCRPYGIPAGCSRSSPVGRYRKVPSWLSAGRPLEIRCSVVDQGASCQNPSGRTTTARVGGTCDREMRPVAGVR